MDRVKFTKTCATTRIPFAWKYPRGLVFLIQKLLGRKLTPAQWQAVYRFQDKKNGVCAWCPEQAVPGKTLCQSCSDNQKVKTKEKKDNGICVQTGCPEKAAPGKSLCQACLDNQKVKKKEKKDNGICTDCPEKAAPDKTRCQRCLDYLKDKEANKKKTGVCVRCPEKAAPGKTYCQPCLDNQKVTRKEKKDKRICVSCPEKAAPGKTRCQPCLDKAKVKKKEKKDNGICTDCPEKAYPGYLMCKTHVIASLVRGVVRSSFYRRGVKDNARTHEITGLEQDEYIAYLESTLPPGVDSPKGYHIDHVIPVSAAGDEQWKLYAVNHYTNLRFLPGAENMAKGATVTKKAVDDFFTRMEPIYKEKFSRPEYTPIPLTEDEVMVLEQDEASYEAMAA